MRFTPLQNGCLIRLLLKSGPGPWKTWTQKTWTLENLDPEKPRAWITWTLNKLDPEKPRLWKTWTLKNLDSEAMK